MKKMLKMTAALLAVVMMGTACAPASNNAGEDENGNIVLKVGSWPSREGADLDLANQRKATFEQANPGVVVEGDTWQYDLQTFYPKAEAGTLPDIFVTPYTEAGKLIDGEYVADLTDVMKKNGFYDSLNPKLRDMVSKDGRIYAFPKNAYTLGLAVNIDLMEKAGLVEADGTPKQPKDWNEMAEFAVKIKEATGTPGFVFPTIKNIGGWYFSNVAWSYGVDFMEQREDGTWEATFNSDEAVTALQFIKDLKWKYDVLPAKSLIDYEEMFKLFATNGAAMMIASKDVLSRARTYEMDIDSFGMVAIPAGPAKHVSLLGGTLTCTPKGASEKKIETTFKWYELVGNGYRLDDASQKAIEANIDKNLEKGQIVGLKNFSVWNSDTDIQKFENQLIEEKSNINLNHVKLYNDSLIGDDVEIQAEEPMCAQDLYSVLDGIIQEVINNKDADCRALIEQANSDFQRNYLDKVDY